MKPKKIPMNIISKMPPIPKGIDKLLPKLIKKHLQINKNMKKSNQPISVLKPGFKDVKAKKKFPQKN